VSSSGPEKTVNEREALVRSLIGVFDNAGYVIHGASGIEGFDHPPSIRNDGYGSGRPRIPDVVGFDRDRRRIVFGLVKTTRESLDSEDALEEYNVFLDHNAGLGESASVLVIMMPQDYLPEFMSIITHYIHREYWHRIVPVASGQLPGAR